MKMGGGKHRVIKKGIEIGAVRTKQNGKFTDFTSGDNSPNKTKIHLQI